MARDGIVLLGIACVTSAGFVLFGGGKNWFHRFAGVVLLIPASLVVLVIALMMGMPRFRRDQQSYQPHIFAVLLTGCPWTGENSTLHP
jgi:ABC-type dipeptide/oligopeptide/nickel transport system permease subunit